jgi:hypothetical protein
MNCNIVLDERSRGWIIEKIARRLADELIVQECHTTVLPQPRFDADINHFMLYLYVAGPIPTKSSVFITHVDCFERMRRVKAALKTADVGICMSRMTVRQLVDAGIDRAKLCYVLPAIDGGIEPRRITVGITTNLYPDGRKRETLLERLAAEIDLSAFHFEIFGAGWRSLVPKIEESGATVRYAEGTADSLQDYAAAREAIPKFDYYLYLGLDEGSLGTLDALSAGVKTITTPQGFHLDILNGITHPFWEYSELRAIFEQLATDRNQRIAAVSALSWAEYAEQHRRVWRTLLEGKKSMLPALLNQEDLSRSSALPVKQYKRSNRGANMLLRAVQRYYLRRINAAARRTARQVLNKLLP